MLPRKKEKQNWLQAHKKKKKKTTHTKKQTNKKTLTCPWGDAFLSCIQLQVKADDCSNNQQSPDHQLQQVTQPRPQLWV